MDIKSSAIMKGNALPFPQVMIHHNARCDDKGIRGSEREPTMAVPRAFPVALANKFRDSDSMLLFLT
jgi:hypothetical protein